MGVGLIKGRLDLADPKTRLVKGHPKFGLLLSKTIGFDLGTLALKTNLSLLALETLSLRVELGQFTLLCHRMRGRHTKLLHLPLDG